MSVVGTAKFVAGLSAVGVGVGALAAGFGAADGLNSVVPKRDGLRYGDFGAAWATARKPALIGAGVAGVIGGVVSFAFVPLSGPPGVGEFAVLVGAGALIGASLVGSGFVGYGIGWRSTD